MPTGPKADEEDYARRHSHGGAAYYSHCRDFAELLRRSRGSGRRRRSMLPFGGRCCSCCFLLFLYLLVMGLVLRGALGRLSGLGLRPTWLSRRSRGGALRFSRRWSLRRGGRGALRFLSRRSLCRGGSGGLGRVLCQNRQRQRKDDKRP